MSFPRAAVGRFRVVSRIVEGPAYVLYRLENGWLLHHNTRPRCGPPPYEVLEPGAHPTGCAATRGQDTSLKRLFETLAAQHPNLA